MISQDRAVIRISLENRGCYFQGGLIDIIAVICIKHYGNRGEIRRSQLFRKGYFAVRDDDPEMLEQGFSCLFSLNWAFRMSQGFELETPDVFIARSQLNGAFEQRKPYLVGQFQN